jgi:aspartyl-tRNA(Asn)/glutamyl-tRNA(Gln) amidotransferase subunit B
VRLKGETKLGTKAEVKNMNSFSNVAKAIDFEIERQIDLIEEGKKVIQQTLLWDADLGEAYPMRSKEEAHDYRYFPDPDLMPVIVSEEWKNEIKNRMPELPDTRRERFIKNYNLPRYDAEILTSSRELADYYENVLTFTNDYKTASNWVMTDVLKIVNEQKITFNDFPIPPQNLCKLIKLIGDNVISGKIAKEVFPEMLSSGKDPEVIVKEKNLVQITDASAIKGIIDNILDANPKQVEEYLNGKDKVVGFFVGQIMKESKGKANPGIVNELLKNKLESRRK